MSIKYQLPRGTKDFLDQEAFLLACFENKARELFRLYGYKEARLPVIENIGVFNKGLGQKTDIVERQIFKIEGKDNLCLRPESTAQIVRAYIQHNLYEHKLCKYFYIGPMFRGERPQKGRLRQFHHIGAEAIGIKSAALDAEVIKLARRLLIYLGVKDFDLKINTLGCKQDKQKLKDILREKLKDKYDSLCDACKKRFSANVLRVLDCKNKKCIDIVDSLNITDAHLCKNCRVYFKELCGYLEVMGIDYKVVPTLVRGLDYYTQTVFEFISESLGAQSAVGAGGRYDDLVENLGGPARAACGFALGAERMMLLLKKQKTPQTGVFLAYDSTAVFNRAFEVLESLRDAGIAADMDFSGRSLKSQLRYSQKQDAKFVVIVTEQELSDDSVILRNMAESEQESVKLSSLTGIISEKTKDYL